MGCAGCGPDFESNPLARLPVGWLATTGKVGNKMTAVGVTDLPILLDRFVRLTKSAVVSIAKIRDCVRGVSSEFVLACDMRRARRQFRGKCSFIGAIQFSIKRAEICLHHVIERVRFFLQNGDVDCMRSPGCRFTVFSRKHDFHEPLHQRSVSGQQGSYLHVPAHARRDFQTHPIRSH